MFCFSRSRRCALLPGEAGALLLVALEILFSSPEMLLEQPEMQDPIGGTAS
jgi:hypothetical protein